MSRGRPGSGGRMPRALPFTGTTATAELIERFGRPFDEPARGCQMLRFDIHQDGDGLILARLSGRELQGGETAMGQVHECMKRLVEPHGLRPRAVIVTIRNSGARPFAERPDLQLVARAIEEGWCKWVAWRDPMRLARELMPAEQFYELLRNNDIGLYFASFGREVSWRQDRLAIRTLNLLGAEEREWIAERTQSALHSRYVAEGRGWPGTKRFGIRRHWATKELEVDPVQWEFVKRIHFGFAEIGAEGVKGIRILRDRLAKLGCELAVEEIRTILRDPIYVTGAYSVNIRSIETPQKPVPLPEPIPPAVFAFNQQLLGARKGKNTRTAVGEFLLNTIEFAHRPCRDLRDRRGLRPLLRGRRQGDRQRLVYRHSPWVPPACHGLVLDREAVDPEVARLLVTLAGDPVLQRAWLSEAPIPALAASTLVDETAVGQLKQRIRQRKRQKAQLTRVYLERADSDGVIDAAAYWELVGAISEEIAELEARLAEAQVSLPEHPEPSAASGLREAMQTILGENGGGEVALVRRTALAAALIREVVVERVEPEQVEIQVVSWLQPHQSVAARPANTRNQGGS